MTKNMSFEEFDIISYFEDKGIDYQIGGKNTSSGWCSIPCLWCLDPSKHLGVNLTAKTFSCFRCGVKGNAISLVSKIDRCSKGEAYNITRKYVNLEAAIERRHYTPEYAKEISLQGLTKNFPDAHRDYLRNRNFDPDHLIRKYDLYAGTMIGDFKFRIVAPVYIDHKMVSLVGRDITNKSDLRYKTLPISKSKMPLKSTLYNIDSVDQDVIVVEGIFDVFRIGDSCVATLGTKFTASQLLLLKGIRNAFILFDADARDQAEHLAEMLNGLVDHTEIITLNEGDPAEMNEWDVRHLRKEIGL